MRFIPACAAKWMLAFGLALLASPGAAQSPAAASPDELLLKSGVVVPRVAARSSAPAESEPARHLLIQFEAGRAKQGIAELTARGIRVLEWVPRNAVSAFVPAGVDPAAIPGVRWTGKLKATDKLAVPWKGVAEVIHVLVDVFPGVKRLEARAAIKRAGGREIFHPYLPGNTLLVEIEAARLTVLASQDVVSFVYPASKDLESKKPIRTCPGAMTAEGAVPNYVASGDGWDGYGQGSASLAYFFVNGTPDIANEQSEVTRAFSTWSQYATIGWSPAASSGQARSVDIRWASGDHGDGNPFDGPLQVLAHAYFPSPPNPETIAGDMHFDDVAGIRALYAPSTGSGADAFEPDDSAGAARAIVSGSQQSHSIYPASDVDFVRFTLAGAADVTIETSGAAGDTRMWLYDANLVLVEFNDDVGAQNLFSRIDRSSANNDALPAGTYYVAVDEYGNNDTIANYNLSLQVVSHALGDAYEPDDVAPQAVPLQPGGAYRHSIAPAADGDYSRFTLVQRSAVVIEASGGNGTDDTRMWLFAQDLSAIEFNDDGGASLHARIDRTQAEGNTLPPGTYYVLVDEDGNDDEIASYDLQLTVFPIASGGADDAYEENDTLDSAWYWGASSEGIWLSSIGGAGIQADDDFYRVDVSPGDERVLATLRLNHADGDIDLYLVDSFGNVLASSTGLTNEENIDVVVPRGGGVYTLAAVYGNAGNAYDLWWDDVVAPTVSPSNDAFANRIGLSGANAGASGHNAAATKEPGEPNHAGQPGGVSVWWGWTAPQTADTEISTGGSPFDTLLAVYTGSSVDALTHVASNDDTPSTLQSAVSFRATANTAYAIAVDGYNGANGAVSLTIAQQQPPPPSLSAAWSSLSSKCKASSNVCRLKGKLLVRNISSGISSPAQAAFYLSADNTFDAGDSAIGGGGVAALKPRKSKKLKLRSTLPAGVTTSGKFVITLLSSAGASQTVVFGPLF